MCVQYCIYTYIHTLCHTHVRYTKVFLCSLYTQYKLYILLIHIHKYIYPIYTGEAFNAARAAHMKRFQAEYGAKNQHELQDVRG